MNDQRQDLLRVSHHVFSSPQVYTSGGGLSSDGERVFAHGPEHSGEPLAWRRLWTSSRADHTARRQSTRRSDDTRPFPPRRNDSGLPSAMPPKPSLPLSLHHSQSRVKNLRVHPAPRWAPKERQEDGLGRKPSAQSRTSSRKGTRCLFPPCATSWQLLGCDPGSGLPKQLGLRGSQGTQHTQIYQGQTGPFALKDEYTPHDSCVRAGANSACLASGCFCFLAMPRCGILLL